MMGKKVVGVAEPGASGPGRARTVPFVLLALTTLGLLFATHFRFYYQIQWPLAVWWGLKNWYLWGALSPAVVWLSRRFPLAGARWRRALVVHGLAAFALVLIHSGLSISLSALVEGLGGASYEEAVRRLFLKKYALGLTIYAAIVAVAQGVETYRGVRRGEARRARWAEDLRRVGGETGGGQPAERLLVRRGDREGFLPVHRIDRIEAEGNYVRILAGDEIFLERRTLSSLEVQLDSARFLRIHRSHLVPVDRIDRIEPRFKGGYQVILRDGTSLPLTRTYRKRLEERIGETF